MGTRHEGARREIVPSWTPMVTIYGIFKDRGERRSSVALA